MEREITDSDGITWICIQAYSGLSQNAENLDAAQVKGQEDTYWVVCTVVAQSRCGSSLRANGKRPTLTRCLLNEIEAQQGV
ncbi:hypothetical protein [Microcoleus asticus]|uniref:Transposase n=1 Tax=Microcoleus asticus IPMA8 TaxID=2563858 RepID=A0ABX2D2C5_9CYAN|nr:hypothetical protein [Microcoleus asticus]NQE36769.1 hypothetical protein [Microcoleus asticus IPMA8]